MINFKFSIVLFVSFINVACVTHRPQTDMVSRASGLWLEVSGQKNPGVENAQAPGTCDIKNLPQVIEVAADGSVQAVIVVSDARYSGILNVRNTPVRVIDGTGFINVGQINGDGRFVAAKDFMAAHGFSGQSAQVRAQLEEPQLRLITSSAIAERISTFQRINEKEFELAKIQIRRCLVVKSNSVREVSI